MRTLENRRIFFHDGDVVDGATVTNSRVPVAGARRIKGTFDASAGAIADDGYPRVVESIDGTTETYVTKVDADAGQDQNAGHSVYPVDVELRGLPYAWVEFKAKGAGHLQALLDLRQE